MMKCVFKLGRLEFSESTTMEQTFHLEEEIYYFESCFYLIVLFVTNESEETRISKYYYCEMSYYFK